MAFRTKKISQMDPKGANLASTDLLEISQLVSGSYVTKSITGAEIIASVPPSVTSWGTITGTLSSQTDLNTALSGKVPTSRTLTINGTTQDLSADRTFTISTGITIGTTAITSGTNGRFLFDDGGVVSETNGAFWDKVNGRFALGNTNPISKFQVTESITTTANEYSAITFDGTITSRATASDTIYGVRSNQNLIATAANQRIIGIDLTPNTTFFNSTTNYIGLKIGGLANSQDSGTALWCVQKSTAGNNGFAINPANNRWEMGFIGSSTSTIITGPKITLHSTGILIGPSGNPDGRLQIGGIGSTSATKTFIARNLANTDLFTIWDDGAIGVNTNTNAGFKLDVNGTARVSGLLTTPLGINLSGWYLYANGTSNASLFGGTSWIFDVVGGGGYRLRTAGNVDRLRIESNGNVLINTTTDVASSKLTIESTTQGFLCPRMTTTQKNAIASPATGLMVFDLTLGLISVYNGTIWISL